MKPHVASLINAVVLIVFSAWGYLGSDDPSFTALIPAAFGVILLALNPGVKKENKVVTHIAVVLTLLLVVALFKPLTAAIDRGDQGATLRVGIMLVATIGALVLFVQRFIDARREREKN